MKPSIQSSRSGLRNIRRQAGFTLIEAMIGLGLSLVVVTSMVGLMSNSLGSATRIIQMSQLTDELRNAMSMMSRDVRRANFNSNAIYCYANSDCGIDGTATQATDVTITISGADTCFLFGLDRDWDGVANNDGGGAFRRDTVNNAKGQSVGVIQMWVGTNEPTCADGNDWVAVTDPDFITITDFTVDSLGSFENSIIEEGGATLTQRTRQVRMQLEGWLILDNRIQRRIEDTIKVRNDIFL